jgi:hypothetical protein
MTHGSRPGMAAMRQRFSTSRLLTLRRNCPCAFATPRRVKNRLLIYILTDIFTSFVEHLSQELAPNNERFFSQILAL